MEATGFGKFLQENISVQSGGDVTVNATLNPGTLQQSVTVEATPPAVEFNSTNQELTIDTKMANDTPRLDRNPFKLTLLEPAAINTRGEMQPYNSWAPNSVDLGGDTNLKNNLLVDGNPIGIGHKAGYPPNQDDVQESVVAQNSVDAASGHSAGGLISLTTKGGTNEWHGQAFYLGRYPWLSAEADRTTFNTNAQRQNMYGGTFGNPILKNKLFNFFSVEDWKIHQPGSYDAYRSDRSGTPGRLLADLCRRWISSHHLRPVQHRRCRQWRRNPDCFSRQQDSLKQIRSGFGCACLLTSSIRIIPELVTTTPTTI